jgi:molybdate transport system substrate-binding protein
MNTAHAAGGAASDRAAQPLHLLSGGAAQGLVAALQARFLATDGVAVEGRFGAVGAMRELLESGAPCDLFIVTARMVRELADAGVLQGATVRDVGRVRTGIAVRADDPAPAIDTPDELRAALLAATAVHFPDPERATAGIHFARVLAELGLADTVRERCRTFPNGATAMRELACAAPGAIGCTQVSEILATPGVKLVGVLPPKFELATMYTAAVPAKATLPEEAARFIELLAGPGTRGERAAAGFEE